jgi:hypothetical protein
MGVATPTELPNLYFGREGTSNMLRSVWLSKQWTRDRVPTHTFFWTQIEARRHQGLISKFRISWITVMIRWLLDLRRNPAPYPNPSSPAGIKGKSRSQAGHSVSWTFALGSLLPVIAIRSPFVWFIEQIVSSILLCLVLSLTRGFRCLGQLQYHHRKLL